jgi:hypothetical protein
MMWFVSIVTVSGLVRDGPRASLKRMPWGPFRRGHDREHGLRLVHAGTVAPGASATLPDGSLIMSAAVDGVVDPGLGPLPEGGGFDLIVARYAP